MLTAVAGMRLFRLNRCVAKRAEKLSIMIDRRFNHDALFLPYSYLLAANRFHNYFLIAPAIFTTLTKFTVKVVLKQ